MRINFPTASEGVAEALDSDVSSAPDKKTIPSPQQAAVGVADTIEAHNQNLFDNAVSSGQNTLPVDVETIPDPSDLGRMPQSIKDESPLDLPGPTPGPNAGMGVFDMLSEAGFTPSIGDSETPPSGNPERPDTPKGLPGLQQHTAGGQIVPQPGDPMSPTPDGGVVGPIDPRFSAPVEPPGPQPAPTDPPEPPPKPDSMLMGLSIMDASQLLNAQVGADTNPTAGVQGTAEPRGPRTPPDPPPKA